MDWVPERDLFLRFQIDANRINARGQLEHMNRLERWHEAGVIEILLSEPAFSEVADPKRMRKAIGYIQTLTHAETEQEVAMLARIEAAVFPRGAVTPGQRNDVQILFNAQKYAHYLVTADGGSARQPRGILGSAAALAELGINVITDVQACDLIESKIQQRDEMAMQWAHVTGRALPGWVGTDK